MVLEDPEPEVVVLARPPGAEFFGGEVATRVDPVHVTVADDFDGTTHACLLGWQPGMYVVEGPAAPPLVSIYAVDEWPEEIELHGRHHPGEVVVGAPGVVVAAPGVVVSGPQIVVGVPGVIVGGPGVVVGGPGPIFVGGGGRGGGHGRGRHGR